ncbi:hypothetical protein SAMN05892883_1702 [Jatrophihabitans sp. GAS493]|uniref:hypothetical protein n=1 Tax=Jatrophihabitans sp. GAS493 TaxID=1907575 RepID=UPI000BC017AF|nr:hypothetical protein [Jatrophihabitans sp. GAS493]SOD72297.1 hypothetical protein SAMN05892883_1702 [Jatrophihabitans sp. GAS493]
MPRIIRPTHVACHRRATVADVRHPFAVVPVALLLILISFIWPVTANAVTPTPEPTGSKSAAKSAPAKATFGIGPATGGRIDNRIQFSYQMATSGTYSDHVAIQNYAAAPVDLSVYAADLENSLDGDLAVPAASVRPKETGTWIKLAAPKQTVHLAAATTGGPGRAVLPFTVQVPYNASPGDHSAVIVASLTTLGKNPKGQNIALDQRIATRIFIRVDGAVHGRLAIDDLKVSYDGSANPLGHGKAHVTYTLRNSGNVKLGAKQAVNVTGMFGTKAIGPVIPDQVLLLPGATLPMSVEILDITPAFMEKVHVVTTPLVVKGDPDPHARGATKTVSFWAIPWALITTVIAAILLIVAAYLIRRWRKNRPTPPAGPRGGGIRPQPPTSDPEPEPAAAEDDHVAPVLIADAVISTPQRRRLALVSAGVVLAAALAWGTSGDASAAALPYNDPSVSGGIGLCSKTGTEITSGNINDRPFVWRAVSSVKAPAGYDISGRKATLVAYQPRPNVQAYAWNGDTLTAASTYTNPAAPMAAATSLDFSLNDFIGEFKPMVDGLLQLRLYLAAPGRDALNTSYPAINIKVTGNTWAVVNPVSVSCTSGDAVSSEESAIARTSASPTAALPSQANPAAGKTSGAAHASAAAKASASRTAEASAARATSIAVAAGHTDASSSGSSWLVWLIGGVVVIGLIAGGGFGWRRYTAARTSRS